VKLKLILATAILGTASAVPSVSSAGIASQSAVYHPLTGEVAFTLVFDHQPDFFSADALGRQADSFQYFIVGDLTLPYPSRYDSLIRGEELHLTIDQIPIRDAVTGALRGSVPYSLTGAELNFSAPLSLISDHTDARTLQYVVETYEFGAFTDGAIGEIVLLTSKQQCNLGGWKQFGFRNQGQCIAFLNGGS
jgi:hypothetical protein